MVEELLTRRIRSTIERFRAWEQSGEGAGQGPFRLACTVAEPATTEEIVAAWPGGSASEDLIALWSSCGEARLFEDVEYGQWGLHLLSPQQSAARTQVEREARPGDVRDDDIVVGEFLGDQELLVRARDPQETLGVLIALPLDPRDDWYRAASDLAEFLERYLAGAGDKYWEASS